MAANFGTVEVVLKDLPEMKELLAEAQEEIERLQGVVAEWEHRDEILRGLHPDAFLLVEKPMTKKTLKALKEAWASQPARFLWW